MLKHTDASSGRNIKLQANPINPRAVGFKVRMNVTRPLPLSDPAIDQVDGAVPWIGLSSSAIASVGLVFTRSPSTGEKREP